MSLLPAIHRLRDVKDLPATDANQLRGLLTVLAEQIAVVEEDLAQLYDDQFVDTCAEWVLPYIGDLLGVSPLYSGDDSGGVTARALFPELNGPRFAPRVAQRIRADVARTVYYRKRKATRPMLEGLAHDVTGWAAHVVEFFELLGWTQWIRNHLRPQCTTVNMRDLAALERLGGAFDTIAHTVDVAPISQDEGWYETRNVGFFLWRLESYSIVDADARADGAAALQRFYIHPAGVQSPLFSRYRPEEFSGATETRVPDAIRPMLLALDLQEYRRLANPPGFSELYGDTGTVESRRRSFVIDNDGDAVPPERICSADLSNWDAADFKPPQNDVVAVDTTSGRVVFGPGRVPKNVRVSYHYGFPAAMGGGPYPRASWLTKRSLVENVIRVAKTGGDAASLKGALALWDRTRNTVIRIEDNRTYHEKDALTINPNTNRAIAIETADGKRPHIRLDYPLVIEGQPNAIVTLSGLLIEGRTEIRNATGRLRILHSTLIPSVAVASIIADDPADPPSEDPLRIELAFSITGPIRSTQAAGGIAILDSIVDAGGGLAIGGLTPLEYGPPATIERTTILGVTRVRALPLATETIFDGPLFVERRQSGCVRFSFVPRKDSLTPRRYRCQPDLEIARQAEAEAEAVGIDSVSEQRLKEITDEVTAWLVPGYTSTIYGDPAYAQLHLRAPRQILRGAEDGSEMGTFCHLKQPQREDNLRARLEEYLPFGLEAGLIYVT